MQPPSQEPRRNSLGRATKGAVLPLLLAVAAVTGPMAAYAGISVIWPSTDVTVDVDESPPITFAAGADHSQANSLGFAGAFTTSDNAAAFTLTVNGMSGGQVTIDNLTHITRDASVASYKLQVATALGGGVDPDVLKLRLWTGATPPTADGDAQVCAVLDLEAAVDTETTGTCTAVDVFVQAVVKLPTGQTTEADSVGVRPSSITFA